MQQKAAFFHVEREVRRHHVAYFAQLKQNRLSDCFGEDMLLNQHHGVRQINFDELMELPLLGFKRRYIMMFDHAFCRRSTQTGIC